MVARNYQLTYGPDRLVFRTSSFKAEKTSVLHSGVYTKEFASMLFASASCVPAYMLIVSIFDISVVARYFVLVLVFVTAFLGSRIFIFKERSLEVIFDKADERAIIVRPGFILKKKR